MQDDERARAGAVLGRIGLDLRCVQDERLWREVGELLLRGFDEERPREERVVRMVRDHPDRDPMRRIGAGERVDDVDHRLLEVRHELLAQPVEALLGNGLLRAGLADDELVLGRTARVATRVDDERTSLREHGLVPRERVRVEHRRRRIQVHPPAGPDSVLRKVHVAGKLGGGHRGRILVPVSGGPAVPADPPLTDGVVTLRPWTADDVDVLVECLNEPEIARWIDQIPQPYTEADARAFLAGGSDAFARFAVTDANAGTVLGGVGVHRVDAPGIARSALFQRSKADMTSARFPSPPRSMLGC